MADIQDIVSHLSERGIGVLITDHNVRETLRITDRAYIVNEGAIFRSGTPESLADDEEVRRVYLGVGFPAGLMPHDALHSGEDSWRSSRRLHTKLVQKLILTPSLQQAIKLLPMSTLELADLLNQEVVENPLLEEVQSDDAQAADGRDAGQDGGRGRTRRAEDRRTGTTGTTPTSSATTWTTGYRPRTQQEVKELPPIENTLSTTSSLADHLEWQLSLQATDETTRTIGDAIIGNLDDDGYLVASVDEIALMGNWSPDQVEAALRLMQGFDPIGVAARDLQECLWLQLRHIGLEGTPGRADRHRAPADAPEPPDPRAGEEARAVDGRPEAAHRDHPAPRPEAGQPVQPPGVASTSSRTSTWSRWTTSTWRRSTKTACRSCGSAPCTGGCSTRARRTPKRRGRT